MYRQTSFMAVFRRKKSKKFSRNDKNDDESRRTCNMSRVNANGYFDEADSADARYETKKTLNAARTKDYKEGAYSHAGGCMPYPAPEEAPDFVRDYSAYYKTERGYHSRSLNSNDGWNTVGTISFINQPILQYSNEIRSAVLMIHGEEVLIMRKKVLILSTSPRNGSNSDALCDSR